MDGLCPGATPTLEPSALHPGVATVRWTTETPGSSVVIWREGDVERRTVDNGASTTDHAVVLAGPAPGATIGWRVYTAAGDKACQTAEEPFTPPAFDVQPVNIALIANEPGASAGFRLLPVEGSPGRVVVIDDAGRVVWNWESDPAYAPADAFIDADGTTVNILTVSKDVENGEGGYHRVTFTGEDTYIPIPYIHHAFAPLPDGRIAFLEADPRPVEDVVVAGDKVVARDPDGQNPVQLFSTWDLWEPDMPALRAQTYDFYTSWLDWTHGNSINVRADGGLLISFHRVSAVVSIDPDGEADWTLTGTNTTVPGDYTLEGDSVDLFQQQHNPVDVDGGILLFDNGPAVAGYSEAARYQLDDAAHTFRKVWSFDWGQEVSSERQGDVQSLPNGNVLVNWGGAGFLTEVTEDQSIVWGIVAKNRFFGFSEQHDRIGGSLP